MFAKNSLKKIYDVIFFKQLKYFRDKKNSVQSKKKSQKYQYNLFSNIQITFSLDKILIIYT